MGHCVLDVDGSVFAQKLPHGIICSETWEGSIPDSGGELIAQTDGRITCLSYAEIKYSWIISGDEESLRLVGLMDAALVKLFPRNRLLRIDELLLTDWRNQHDDLRGTTNGYDSLLEWTSTQDDRHWKHFPPDVAG